MATVTPPAGRVGYPLRDVLTRLNGHLTMSDTLKKVLLGLCAAVALLLVWSTYQEVSGPSRATNDSIDEIQQKLDAINESKEQR
jgi:uncharacterized membrane protein YuzA (DUF378 family)